jgi:hypothetical protein
MLDQLGHYGNQTGWQEHQGISQSWVMEAS